MVRKDGYGSVASGSPQVSAHTQHRLSTILPWEAAGPLSELPAAQMGVAGL